jgi:hypothetical protein
MARKSNSRRNPQTLLETLERRQMLSIAVSSGIVEVKGSAAYDHVLISVVPTNHKQIRVNLNGIAQAFAKTSLKGIKIDTGAGRDTIIVDQSNGAVNVPMTITGGAGADYIIGGSGADEISGGGGKDRINGGAGDDSISGGASRDLIAGSAGNDTIIGGSGDDAIDGGVGNDLLSGGTGDDAVVGDDGADTLTGGSDSDNLDGGSGADSISGGRGDDDLDGGFGADNLTGGTGADGFATDEVSTDTITDKTNGTDTVYTPFSLDQIPQHYQDLFHTTFPNSDPTSVRINDDQTFEMLYKFNGDGNTYHALFTFQGSDPFANIESVSLLKYEVAPTNIPPNTFKAFMDQYPNAVIKEVIVDHLGQEKFATIRIKLGDSETMWVHADWLDND